MNPDLVADIIEEAAKIGFNINESRLKIVLSYLNKIGEEKFGSLVSMKFHIDKEDSFLVIGISKIETIGTVKVLHYPESEYNEKCCLRFLSTDLTDLVEKIRRSRIEPLSLS